MMKKMLKRIQGDKFTTALICILLAICICSMSAGTALRAAAFFFSPKSAFTLKYEKQQELGKGNIFYKKTLYRIVENPPVEKATEGELYTWEVYSLGPFHLAIYYGEA